MFGNGCGSRGGGQQVLGLYPYQRSILITPGSIVGEMSANIILENLKFPLKRPKIMSPGL